MEQLKRRDGQAMLEYILVFAALLALVAVAMAFSRAARKAAVATSEIVTSDSP